MVRFAFRDPTPPLNLADWRELARRKLPDIAWHYVDGAADDHAALAGNRAGFGKWHLRQRILAGVNKPNLATRIAGTDVALPVALAPCGA
ncbi:MAG: alpha-hydroxy-acid oxidizing protein, partial [Altererythrobacter sp.]|uniref:alpha-hydroxy-acid oxidizing protein n=1 Tax=Altererythrobacter sp. TaxID=1872480 RepID=UPI001B2C91F0